MAAPRRGSRWAAGVSGRKRGEATPCPSPAAYRRHLLYGEAPCEGCRRANADYSRAWKKARSQKAGAPMGTTPLVDLPGELWSAIPRHPGYLASNLGRIRSVDRVIHCRNGAQQRWPGRLLTIYARSGSGRRTVSCGGTTRLVHQLVLEAFVGPRPSGMEGCHRNDNPSDNALSNLRWDTPRENRLDVVRNGNHELANRRQCPRGHDLYVPNLTASSLKRGRRDCLACHRARARLQWLRRRGEDGDMQGISDSYYRVITSHESAA